jgi:hypothetical protein
MKSTRVFSLRNLFDNIAQNIVLPAWRGRVSYIYSALLNDLFFSVNNIYSNVDNTFTYINFTPFQLFGKSRKRKTTRFSFSESPENEKQLDSAFRKVPKTKKIFSRLRACVKSIFVTTEIVIARSPHATLGAGSATWQSLTINAFLGRDCFATLAMTALFGHFCVFSHSRLRAFRRLSAIIFIYLLFN